MPELIAGNLKPFKYDEKCFFISPQKLFLFLIHLIFFHTFWVM